MRVADVAARFEVPYYRLVWFINRYHPRQIQQLRRAAGLSVRPSALP